MVYLSSLNKLEDILPQAMLFDVYDTLSESLLWCAHVNYRAGEIQDRKNG